MYFVLPSQAWKLRRESTLRAHGYTPTNLNYEHKKKIIDLSLNRKMFSRKETALERFSEW